MDRGARGSGDGNAAAADHCGFFAWDQSVEPTHSADGSEAVVLLGISEGVPDLYSRARWRRARVEARIRRVRPFFLDPPLGLGVLCWPNRELPGSGDAGNTNGCAGANRGADGCADVNGCAGANRGADGCADVNGCAGGVPCCAAFIFACVVCICFSTVCI